MKKNFLVLPKLGINRAIFKLGGIASLSIALVFLISIKKSYACSRILYHGDGIEITGRSNDWYNSQHNNFWVYPRGLERNGASGSNTIKWTSKYGSITLGGYDITTIDGLNEKGLSVNVLYLSEADYGTITKDDKRKSMSLAAWGQYTLDNFATVKEVVDAFKKNEFYITQVDTPDGHAGKAHLSISDPTGDSAIFEYIKGELVIHHGSQYQVMTNSPEFDKQLTLTNYWETIGGTTFLPGTNKAADRFVRGSFYLKAIPKPKSDEESLAAVMSIVRNISVPLGITTPGQPNISSTQWRILADHKNLAYYLESPRSPYMIWTKISDFDFSPGSSTKKLTLTEGSTFEKDGKFVYGNVSDYFVDAIPFEFLGAPAVK